MMATKEVQVAALLMDLEAALRNLGFWDEELPAPEALQSPEPFCVDTLEFYQWLQWIFIPRLYQDLDMGNPLPAQCHILPIAQEWARMRALSARGLLGVVEEIDNVLSGGQGQ